MNTILIVEDDKVIRDELSRLLETFGYRTVALEKFDNVVEDIKSLSYNLILLDINLPNENGFEICKRIRENNSVPIIFVTSRNSEEDELRSIITGGSDF
ncbi:MAG: response regulator, partial [Intestinibacter sp.]